MSYKKGIYFEQIAKRYLINKGMEFIDNNVSFLEGEIDLVFKFRDSIRFVEVKSISKKTQFDIYNQLGKVKQNRLLDAIGMYIDKHDYYGDFWQLDFLGIIYYKDIVEIEFLENIEVN